MRIVDEHLQRWVPLNADLKLLDILKNTTPTTPISVGHSGSYSEIYYFDVSD